MARTKYRWDEQLKKLVEVGADYVAPLRPMVVGDSHYDGLRATDGTPVDSKVKHREYMKRNNLALVGDFKETWSKPPPDPVKADRAERRELLGRLMYAQEMGRGKKSGGSR